MTKHGSCSTGSIRNLPQRPGARSILRLTRVVAFIAGAIVSGGLSEAAAQEQDRDLFRFSGEGLFDGAFGPLHEIQVAVGAALRKCGSKTMLNASGRMDPRAQEGFKALSACPDVSPKLAVGSEARSGAVTSQLWTALVGTAEPTAEDRARTLMLTFEATDYTAMEWNFCQSRPIYAPPKQPTCHSNDPHSFMTRGPNGATAGGGREVQAILGDLEAAAPGKVAAAFLRLLRLRAAAADTEIYVCGVWVDPVRREAWRAGFLALGADRAYRASALSPSEIDFVFFKDRSAHMSMDYGAVAAAVAGAAAPAVDHWKVRRAIALGVRPSGNARIASAGAWPST